MTYLIDIVEIDRLLVKYKLTDNFSRYSLYKVLFNLYGLLHDDRPKPLSLEIEYMVVSKILYSKNIDDIAVVMNNEVLRTTKVITYDVMPAFVDHLYNQLSKSGEYVMINDFKINSRWKYANVNTNPMYASRRYINDQSDWV